MTAVPLSKLRVMPPIGSPGVAVVDACDEDLEGYTIKAGSPCVILGADRHMVAAMSTEPGAWHPRPYSREHIALDLTAPTTPRIDGATVAATMLANAYDMPTLGGIAWGANIVHYDGARHAFIRLTTTKRDGYNYEQDTENIVTDATDPRDILAAVLLAVLGVTP